MELLKLSTLLSHTCSMSSSWLMGLPRLSSRYSRMPLSLRVSDRACPFAAAARRGARFFLLEAARRSDAAAVWRGMAQKALKKYAVYACILLYPAFAGGRYDIELLRRRRAAEWRWI